MYRIASFLLSAALLGAGWTTQPSAFWTCPGNAPTATTAHFAGRCFSSPGGTWQLEEVVVWYSPQATNTFSSYTAQYIWDGRVEIAGFETMIEKPTHVGSVQVVVWWDGLTDNINIYKGNYVAQLLLTDNPSGPTNPFTGGDSRPPRAMILRIAAEAAKELSAKLP